MKKNRIKYNHRCSSCCFFKCCFFCSLCNMSWCKWWKSCIRKICNYYRLGWS